MATAWRKQGGYWVLGLIAIARVAIRNLLTDRDGQISKVECWVERVYQGAHSSRYKYLS
ncbi:hypothetical protein [Pseudoalteromonas sp. SMS1]|uniref:hypothetical protein n=1 Tax=Pseudoalteromonas sp. SMS1 TaxID=2908894 RepID=UPI001F3F185E|nr:hypothetical protein [Pseudoalteromonas sp. SMS1]